MGAEYQGVCAAPAAAPALHCQIGNDLWAKLFFIIYLKTFRDLHLTTESSGPCLNLLWKANASAFTPSPGPLMNPLDVCTGISSDHVCHRDSWHNHHNRDNGHKQEDCELTPAKLTQAEIFSRHRQQQVPDMFHYHLWMTLPDALLQHPMLISLCLDWMMKQLKA